MAQNAASPTRHMAVFFVSPDKCQSLRLIRKLMGLRLPYARTLPNANLTPIKGKGHACPTMKRKQRSRLTWEKR